MDNNFAQDTDETDWLICNDDDDKSMWCIPMVKDDKNDSLEKIMTKMSSCKRRTKWIYYNFYFIINSSRIQRLDSLFMGQGWHSNHSTCPPSSVSRSTPGYSITWVEFLGSLLCCYTGFSCVFHFSRLTKNDWLALIWIEVSPTSRPLVPDYIRKFRPQLFKRWITLSTG